MMHGAEDGDIEGLTDAEGDGEVEVVDEIDGDGVREGDGVTDGVGEIPSLSMPSFSSDGVIISWPASSLTAITSSFAIIEASWNF